MLAGIVNSTVQAVPHEIGVNQSWMGMMYYTDETRRYRAEGKLYVGVLCSHSNREFLKRVPAERAIASKYRLPS